MTEHLTRFLISVYTDRSNPTDTRLRALELLLELSRREPELVASIWSSSDV